MIAVGGGVFAVLMALSARYGFDRDELYFLDGARHLQASYVDQPVLAPLLAWVSLKLFGVSLPGLRVWPALAAWATVVAGGLTGREFGGGRRAQLLAAVGAATMPVLLAAAHVANTTAYALLGWAGLALIVARIGRTGDCRWWLASGLVAGLGVADDHSAAFFAVAVVIGAPLSGGRQMVWNRWFAAGAAIAVAVEVPDPNTGRPDRPANLPGGVDRRGRRAGFVGLDPAGRGMLRRPEDRPASEADDHAAFSGYRPGRALVRWSRAGFPAGVAATRRNSPGSSEPVTTEVRCYPGSVRPPAWVPRLSGASPVSSSSEAWRTSPATASRS